MRLPSPAPRWRFDNAVPVPVVLPVVDPALERRGGTQDRRFRFLGVDVTLTSGSASFARSLSFSAAFCFSYESLVTVSCPSPFRLSFGCPSGDSTNAPNSSSIALGLGVGVNVGVIGSRMEGNGDSSVDGVGEPPKEPEYVYELT